MLLSLRSLMPLALGLLSFFQSPLRADEESTVVPVPKVAVLPPAKDWVTSLAFSADGKTLAIGTKESVSLFDIEKRTSRATLSGIKGQVRALSFSPDGSQLAVGSYQSVQLWNAAAAERIHEWKGHRGYVTGVSFSPDGQRIVTSSDDETARVWTLAGSEAQAVLTGHGYPVNAVAWSADGHSIATAAGDDTRVTKPGEVKVWDAATATELFSLGDHKRAAMTVAFSFDSKTLASGGLDEKVILTNLETQQPIGSFNGHQRPVNCVLFHPDGKTMISGSGGRFAKGHTVKLWNRETGEELASLEDHEGRISALALSKDGSLLASGSHDKQVILWSLAALGSGSDTEPPADALNPGSSQIRSLLPRLRGEGGRRPDEGVVTDVDVAKTVAPRATRQTVRPLTLTLSPAAGARGPEKRSVVKTVSLNRALAADSKIIRVGVIGLDTSHCGVFAGEMNKENPEEDVAGVRIVAAYPKGSPDIESSVTRVPGYTEDYKKRGIEIVDSIPALLEKVDAVCLETNDGRPHFEQLIPVLKAGKPCFIDKPIAGTLVDAIAIFEASKKYKVPVFSSSSLRYMPMAQKVRGGAGEIGEILGCDAFSPASLEPTHPDLFWYGIHGVEALFTVMGTGCESVQRASTPGFDVVMGTWNGGRVGTFRGIRQGGSGYGGRVFGSKGVVDLGGTGGYRPLVVEIVKFFKTKQPPVAEAETLEIYAFMEAADESKRQGGKPVKLSDVMNKARAEAAKKIEALK